MYDFSNFRPMRSDVLLIKRPDEQRGMIIVKEFSDETSQHYIVAATGPQVVTLCVGDIVIADWRKMTPPFDQADVNGKTTKVAITAEKEIHAIVVE